MPVLHGCSFNCYYDLLPRRRAQTKPTVFLGSINTNICWKGLLTGSQTNQKEQTYQNEKDYGKKKVIGNIEYFRMFYERKGERPLKPNEEPMERYSSVIVRRLFETSICRIRWKARREHSFLCRFQCVFPFGVFTVARFIGWKRKLLLLAALMSFTVFFFKSEKKEFRGVFTESRQTYGLNLSYIYIWWLWSKHTEWNCLSLNRIGNVEWSVHLNFY